MPLNGVVAMLTLALAVGVAPVVAAPLSLTPPMLVPVPLPAPETPPPASTPALPIDALPRRLDAETGVSPIYAINARQCQNRDGEGAEGEDFLRKCKGYGGYALRASGFDYRVNYGIESTDPHQDFLVMLFPLEDGPAGSYARADLYDEKLAEPIEWCLDAQGRPYAVIVRATFYKCLNSPRSFQKNKVAEFYLVRGLIGQESLKEDVPTANTAFDPLQQARLIARGRLKGEPK